MHDKCEMCSAGLDEPGQNETHGDLLMPRGLSEAGQQAYRKVMSFLYEKDMLYTGGCKAFYAPEYWERREPEFSSENALLVIVHDGGDLSYITNYDKGQYALIEAFQAHMGDWLVEQCTSWYSAVYMDPIPENGEQAPE